LRVAIHKKNSDGTKGEFLRNSPEIELSVERNVWIVGIGNVKVKPKGSDDTSYITAPSEVVGLVGSSFTFKAIPDPSNAPAWPSDQPKWTINDVSSTGETTDCTSESNSITIECTCGNTKTVTLSGIKPTLDSVDFKDGGVQTIKDVGTEPEWKKANNNGQGGRNEPFCVKKDSNYNINCKFSLSKSLTFDTTVNRRCSIISDDTNVAGVIDTKSFSFKNQSAEFVVPHISVNKVKSDTLNIEWSYIRQNDNKYEVFSSTSHTRYTTWDTYKCQANDFTKAHIKFACDTANGATTLTIMGDMIGQNVMDDEFFVTANPTNCIKSTQEDLIWSLVDTRSNNNPVTGDCIVLAMLMKKIIQLLGDDSAKVAYVYARTSSWNGLVNNTHSQNEKRRQIPSTKKLWLGFYSGSFNYFEGCCVFQNKWWLGGLGKSENSALDVLYYVSKNNINENAEGDNGQRQCWHNINDVDTREHKYRVKYPTGTPTTQQQSVP
jgi:hypothetical protein